jgi:MYXO-CTERM domain-containing protein
VTYRIPKHVLFSLGTLTAGTLAAALAASCAQNDQGEPRGVLQGSATVRPPIATIAPAPTFTINPCTPTKIAECEKAFQDSDLCTYHCKVESGQAKCGSFPTVCQDRNDCTTDSCNPKTGCVYTNNSEACNDGDPCTTADACGRGTCSGTPIGCNDNNTCTTDSCKEGNCIFSPVETGTDCDDQNGCTDSDACTAAGVCVGSGGPDCDDGDPCTKNQCSNSACYHTEYEAEGTPCLNANKCLVNTTCHSNGECTSLEEKNCDDNNPCTVDSCDPESGCVNEPDNTLECDDGNVCTLGDRCVEGVCTPESGVECAPIDECHEAGECDPTNGVCDDPRKADGAECENTGTCKSGRCEGGTPDPVGEGGSGNEPVPSAGAGGEAPSGEGGSPSVPGAAGDTSTGATDSGGEAGAPSRPSTGGRASTPPGAGGDADNGKGEEFKRDPGGCSYGAANGPASLAPVFALFGLAALGLRRRKTGR